MPPFRLPGTQLEGTTPVFTASIIRDDGGIVPGTGLLSITLTYFDVRSGAILNTRLGQNVLQTNNVTIDNAGLLTWTLQPADTAMVNRADETELHRALFLWSWDVGKFAAHEVEVWIERVGPDVA